MCRLSMWTCSTVRSPSNPSSISTNRLLPLLRVYSVPTRS